MHRTFSKFAIVGAAFAVLIGLSVSITGEPGSKLRVQPASKHHVGMVDDWSFHHLVFSNPGAYEQVAKDPAAYSRWLNIQYDTRYILQQSKRTATANLTAAMLRLVPKPKPKPKPQPPQVSMQRDWSVSLGSGGVAATMDPAKYTWDVNANPSCTNDFAVYPVNATPGSGQANLVGFNSLYSASTGTNFCSGTGPSVIFAYDVGSGPIETSPVISLDGTKVAFVESASAAVFHVLTIATSTNNTLTFIGGGTSPTSAVAPSSSNNAAITLNGSPTVTLSSPFVYYDGDIAYVGDDSGKLHKFWPVFNGTPAECTSTNTGGSCGSGWPVAVAPTGTILTGPIYDGSTNVFVGGSDGNLYAVNGSTGAVRMAVISGRNYSGGACGGKIVDAPVVDSTLGTVITQTLPSSYGGASCPNEGVLMQLDSATPATPPNWAASHAYALGTLITDSNNNIEWCAMAGTSVGTQPTTWSTTKGGTTTESGGTGTPVWVNVGTNPLNPRAIVDAGSGPSAQPLYAGTFDQAYFNASGKGGNFYYCALQQPTLKVATFNASTGNIQAGSGTSQYGGSGSQCGPLTEIYNANAPIYAAHQTGSFTGLPTATGTATIGGTLVLTATGAVASATGTFSTSPLPSDSITITNGANNLTMTTSATAKQATGTFSLPPVSNTSISIGSGSNTLAMTTNATAKQATGTISAPPLSSDSLTITSGTNTLTLTTNGTGKSFPGTFSLPPVSTTTITITSGTNILTMTSNATAKQATGTFSALPVSSDAFTITSGANTLTLTTNAATKQATGTLKLPQLPGQSISITSTPVTGGSNTLVLTSAGAAQITFVNTTVAGDTITIGGLVYDFQSAQASCVAGQRCVHAASNTTSAGNLVSAIAGTCYDGNCSGNDPSVTAPTKSSNTILVLNSTAGPVSWSTNTANITLSVASIAAPSANACSGTAPTFNGTFTPSFDTTAMASSMATAIGRCPAAASVSAAPSGATVLVADTIPGNFTFSVTTTNPSATFTWGTPNTPSNGSAACSLPTGTFITDSNTTNLASNLATTIGKCATALGVSVIWNSNATLTVTDTTLGNYPTFTVGSNNTGTFSWGSVSAATDGSNTCPGSTAGTFATSGTTAGLASNLATAIGICPTTAGVSATYPGTNGSSSLTVTDTTPGSSPTFTTGLTNASGIFAWGSATAGTNGSNACSSSTTGTFTTNGTTSTLATTLATVINSCPAAAGVSATPSSNTVVVADTTPGTFPTFTVASNNPSTFSWGSVSAGTNGSNACGSSTTGTFQTDSSTTTLASNLATAIGMCPSGAGVSATPSTNTVTVTDTTPGTFPTFTVSGSNIAGPPVIFSWGSVGAGSNGSNTCGSSTTGTFATDSSTTNLATNLAAAINFCPAAVGVSGTSNTNVVTVTALAAGTAGNSVGLAKSMTGFTWSGLHLSGGVDGSDTGLNFSVGANTTAAAAHLASAITRMGGTVGVTGSSAGNVVAVTAITPGTAGNSITVAESLSNFTWAGSTLTGGGGGPKDWLFAGVPSTTLSKGTCSNGNGCILSFDITGGTFPSGGASQGVAESGGTSGIIIDNVFSEPTWVANNAYSLNTLITDVNGNVEECTTAGTSGSSAPIWNTTVGGTTSDGTGALVWTNEGPNQTSSAYFGPLGADTAVKLTQSGLK